MANRKEKNVSVINTFTESVDIVVGHYGNEILAQNKPKVRSADWAAFRLHYIVRGGVLLQYEKKSVQLNAHTFYLLRPDCEISYSPAPELHTEIYWVTFTGNSAASFCNTLQLTESSPFVTIPPEYVARTQKTFSEVFDKKLPPPTPFMRNLLFLKNLLRLFEIIYSALPHTQVAELSQSEKSHIQNILDYVHKTFTDPSLSVAGTALALNLNADYVSRLFRKQMSVTFTRYVTQKRIEHAVSLFLKGAVSVSQVAYLSGFSDPLYFSKVFKTLNGVTPSDCIKQNRQQ